MRIFDFTPYYRATAPDWPPYDIEKKGQDEYRITIAVAGFAPNEVELVQQGATLLVSGEKAERKGAETLHRGIPNTSFKLSFNLADHVKVVGAILENGLLTIDLVHEAPERLKPRRIEITTGESIARDNPPKQIDAAKAA